MDFHEEFTYQPEEYVDIETQSCSHFRENQHANERTLT